MSTGEVRFRDFTWRPMGRRHPVIAGFDLTVEPGERVLLVGPSGAGKSTLLHGLAGALGSTIAGELSGTAHVDGRLGLLLQNPADAIVAERIGRDVAFGLENAALPAAQIWPLVDTALAAVGLTYPRDHFTGALSGGEQQRLALAGVLAMHPDVLLLDEPTSMLDPDTATSVREAVLAATRDRTLIVVEHRIGPWLPHVDRVVVLGPGGVVVSDGTVASFSGWERAVWSLDARHDRAAPARRPRWAGRPGRRGPDRDGAGRLGRAGHAHAARDAAHHGPEGSDHVDRARPGHGVHGTQRRGQVDRVGGARRAAQACLGHGDT
ncbi:ABC transporter ATP-binding protein [Aeromicrobium sp. UC242_57]|uniref:ABC transporter ATP-binding protein n=1 Tax=Aeromicrobium sp. UC242_57 TaxID=3374624 RepID=UPI00379F6AE1